MASCRPQRRHSCRWQREALRGKNPGLSMSAAIDRAMTDKKVRKALDDERQARLASASRIYG
jgi:hypothetical protein